ncbi:hypothetical protein L3Q67_38980 [Saccharothrix sp. AJ9571]|nr:hypothetical protein L3Q67_38980 [Saccharothrix sp. AJ9571]
MCAALLGFGAVSATQATAAEPPAAAPQAAVQLSSYWELYYDQWFNSAAKWEARGMDVTDPSSWHYIPGTIRYDCFLGSGHTKWSMMIERCDCRIESGDARRSISIG